MEEAWTGENLGIKIRYGAVVIIQVRATEFAN